MCSWSARGAAIIALMVSLVGCSTSTPPESSGVEGTEGTLFTTVAEGHAFAVKNSYSVMAQTLEDGVVTREEYTSAINDFINCQKELGWTYTEEPVWNPPDNLNLIFDGVAPQTTPTAEYQAALAVCSEKIEYISYLFQTTATAFTDPPLLSYIQDCLTEKKVAFTPGGASFAELVGPDASNSADFEAINSCVGDGMKSLYPGMAYSIAF
ncbi:MAG: hypothetical protein ACRCSP_09290 [Rhodoglobus sp.]